MSEQNSLVLDLGPQNGGTRHLRDVDELKAWLGSEHQFWSWASQDSGYGGSQYWRTFANLHRNALAQLSSASATADLNMRNSHINNTVVLISEQYRTNKLFSGDSQNGKFIATVRKDYPNQALAALEYIYRSALLSSSNAEAVAGFVRGVLFKSGIGTQEAEKAALTDLYGQVSRLITQSSAELDSLLARKAALERDITQLLEEAKSSQKDALEKFSVEAATLIAGVNKAAADAVTEGAKTLAATNQTYKEQMRMRASVEYWNRESKNYLIIAGLLGMAFIACCILAINKSGDLLSWLLQPSQTPVVASFEGIPLWKYGLTLIFLGLAVWILRTLLRACLSYLHLYTDAGQRVVMVQTFLALIQDKADIQPQDREIILRALFRPAKIGLLGKDGEMITVLDAVAKRFGNEKG